MARYCFSSKRQARSLRRFPTIAAATERRLQPDHQTFTLRSEPCPLARAGTVSSSEVASVPGDCHFQACRSLSHWLSFPSYKQYVAPYVGDPAADGSNTITGAAYDANGAQIGATQTVNVSAPSNVYWSFVFSSSQHDIAYVKLTGG